jgi:immune inhibitor A
MNNGKKALLPVALILVACLCCLGIGGSSLAVYWVLQPGSNPTAAIGQTAAAPAATSQSASAPTQATTDQSAPASESGGGAATAQPGGSPLDLSQPAPPEALETLQTMIEGDPPAGSLVEQAERLKGITGIPKVISDNASPVPVGSTAQFFVSNSDDDSNSTITAVMRYATAHVYFWVQKEVTADDDDIRRVVDTFENKIYPTDREFFGSEWTPGIDGDPHLYILWTGGLGRNTAGYYCSADEVSRKAHPFSNQHEMFYMNADAMELSDPFVLGVLAHEFQHMIHWYADPNEDTWVNEGFSELAMFLNGYSVGGEDWMYTNNPDLQLNAWTDINDNEVGGHYGGAFLFMNYFLGRFGTEATQALVRSPLNGLVGIDAIFQQLGIQDPSGTRVLVSEDVMADFGAALLVQDPSLENGRYGFSEYPQAPSVGDITDVNSCPSQKESKKVSQFGFDYYAINCGGAYTIFFAGQTTQKVLPVEPQDGKYYIWSNRGDSSDMTMTRAFDLPAGKSATLEFDAWYDIEENWDYAYAEVSTDGGSTWKILHTQTGTDSNPQGNSYGFGWTGASNGWVKESVDLTPFAGKNVLVRFEYVTDAALNGEGLIIDNIRIPEINYATDFEKDLDGWDARGFVRIQNVLPQTYRVLVVRMGAQTTVEEIKLDDRMSGGYSVSAADNEDVYLIVLGTARYTRQKAPYQFIVVT